MSDYKKNIEAFIHKVLEIQKDKTEKPLSQQELRDIAQDLNITDEDWQHIEQIYQDHYKRGHAFLEHQNWEDALEEFKQAQAIKPSEPSILYDIASVYKGLWDEHKKKQDKQNAIFYARQCLNFQADHQGAVQLISDFKRNVFRLKKKRSQKRKEGWLKFRRNFFFALRSLAFLFLMFLFFRYALSNYGAKSKGSGERKKPKTYNYSSPQVENIELPVELVEDEKSKGLYIKKESSVYEFEHGENSVSLYKFLGDIYVEGYIVNMLQLKIEILNEQDSVVSTVVRKLVDSYNPAFRPGDAIPVQYTQNTLDIEDKNWKSIRFKVDVVRKEALPNNLRPENYPKVKIIWNYNASSNFNLQIKDREKTKTEVRGYYGKKDKVFVSPVLEIKNTGKYPIRHLILEVQWINQKEEIISSKEIKANLSWMSSWKVNQQRRISAQHTLYDIKSGDIKGYQVLIKEIN